MQQSPEPTIARTGRILAAAKEGFGVGYISSATLIAAGQLLLGNPLTMIESAWTIATMTNPFVMTAAAVGAVVYGYSALNDAERQALHDQLSRGLTIGVELVKSIIRFARDTAKTLLSEENLAQLKGYVADQAKLFGRTLSDVTHKLGDVVSDGVDTVKDKARQTGQVIAERGTAVREKAEDAADVIGDVVVKTKRKVRSQAAALPALPARGSAQ